MRIATVALMAFAVSASPIVYAQGPPATKGGPATRVEVVNSPADPVPVTGVIEVTGNTNVKVTNDVANPIPVTAVNLKEPTLDAFQTRVLFAGGNPQSDKEFMVPAGKRLVIQSISFSASMGSAQRPEVFLTMTVNGKTSVHYMPAVFAGTDAPRDIYQGLHETRFFADPGTTVNVFCNTVSFSGTGGCSLDMSVSGELVLVP